MFQPAKTDTGARLPWEYMGAAKGDYTVGQMLQVGSDGHLEAISADMTTTPPYLCMGEITVENDGDPIPVTRVADDAIYETTLTAAATGAVVGTKLQVASGGLGVSKPATGSGTFEVKWLAGDAAGDVVRGRFV